MVFPRARIAVFLDGCFWHGCPLHGTWPKNNAAWWREKIEANIARDRDTDCRLKELGWIVIRVWEHEPVDVVVDRLEPALRGAAPQMEKTRP
jgi:DNA mismatch endonuclease, patch repair protein